MLDVVARELPAAPATDLTPFLRAALQRAGIDVVMMTGDNRRTAEAAAQHHQ